MKEIYLAILEKRNSPAFQKQYFMEILERLTGDPRALVEIYLNYDCDRTALENIFQKYALPVVLGSTSLFRIEANVFVVSSSKSRGTPVYRQP